MPKKEIIFIADRLGDDNTMQLLGVFMKMENLDYELLMTLPDKENLINEINDDENIKAVIAYIIGTEDTFMISLLSKSEKIVIYLTSGEFSGDIINGNQVSKVIDVNNLGEVVEEIKKLK